MIARDPLHGATCPLLCEAMLLAVCCTSRIHHSLPSPLKLRITLEDSNGVSGEFTTAHKNEPLDLPTLDSVNKSRKGSALAEVLVSADDLERQKRVGVYVRAHSH